MRLIATSAAVLAAALSGCTVTDPMPNTFTGGPFQSSPYKGAAPADADPLYPDDRYINIKTAKGSVHIFRSWLEKRYDETLWDSDNG